jgi:hypothetical protein
VEFRVGRDLDFAEEFNSGYQGRVVVNGVVDVRRLI